jgi:hypothetical protein
MKVQGKGERLPPPPRQRTLSTPPSLSSTPPPPISSNEKGFALNVDENPIKNTILSRRLSTSTSTSNSNSNSNAGLISTLGSTLGSRSNSMSNAEQDPFFISAKNYVIKKLELEELKEELESAKYEETMKTSEYSNIFPKENIYKKDKGTSLDKFLKRVSVEEIATRIQQKEAELIELKKEYEKKPSAPDKLQSEIISFNSTLDSYIQNKKKLMDRIPVIQNKMKEAITFRDVLNEFIKKDEEDETKHTVESNEVSKINKIWIPNYKEYYRLCTEIRDLFPNIQNLRVITKLYKNLNPLSKYVGESLFNRVIYTRVDLSKRFELLKTHVFEILKGLEVHDEHYKMILDPKMPAFPGDKRKLLSNHQATNRRLEKLNKSLINQLSEITMNIDSIVESHVKEIREKLEEKERELNELKEIQEKPDEEKQKLIDELNKQLSESEQKYQEEMARLKNENESLTGNEEPNENARIIENMTEDQGILRREIERLKGLLNAKPEELTQQIETKKEEVEEQQETNKFLLLVINAADLYEKEGFEESFDHLLDYQPDDKFMFDYAFSQIEQEKGKYEYLDEFLRNPVKMPDQIYNDQLIPQIKGTLAFRPILQTH